MSHHHHHHVVQVCACNKCPQPGHSKGKGVLMSLSSKGFLAGRKGRGLGGVAQKESVFHKAVYEYLVYQYSKQHSYSHSISSAGSSLPLTQMVEAPLTWMNSSNPNCHGGIGTRKSRDTQWIHSNM